MQVVAVGLSHAYTASRQPADSNFAFSIRRHDALLFPAELEAHQGEEDAKIGAKKEIRLNPSNSVSDRHPCMRRFFLHLPSGQPRAASGGPQLATVAGRRQFGPQPRSDRRGSWLLGVDHDIPRLRILLLRDAGPVSFLSRAPLSVTSEWCAACLSPFRSLPTEDAASLFELRRDYGGKMKPRLAKKRQVRTCTAEGLWL